MIEIKNFEDNSIDLPYRTEPLGLMQEQQNDEVLWEVILSKDRGFREQSLSLPIVYGKIGNSLTN